MIPIVVLASGRGSNFDAIELAIREKRLSAEILAVVSDRPQAPVLEKARNLGIPAIAVPFPKGNGQETQISRRREHESMLLEKLNEIGPQFLVMAGYMRIITSDLIEAYRTEKGYVRIVNIHPSILPAFPGTDAYAQAFKYGTKVSGVTVHLVETEVDSGPICAQETFPIHDCLSEEDVVRRGLAVEHRLFPETLSWVLPERFSVEHRGEGRLYVRPN